MLLTFLNVCQLLLIHPVRPGVRQDLVVTDDVGEMGGFAQDAWSETSVAVAVARRHVRLVDGDPVLDAIAELSEAEPRVFLKPDSNVSILPSSQILQHLGEVRVMQGDEGFDAVIDQEVDQVVVVENSLGVDRSGA